jgi:rhodanese-related sulfurtransferase
MNVLRSLLGGAPQENQALARMLKAGAVIVDVRTPAEFAQGHATNSRNVPLRADFTTRLHELGSDKSRPVVTCCRSGQRSASAAEMLTKAGYTSVMNGGPWQSVQALLELEAKNAHGDESS